MTWMHDRSVEVLNHRKSAQKRETTGKRLQADGGDGCVWMTGGGEAAGDAAGV